MRVPAQGAGRDDSRESVMSRQCAVSHTTWRDLRHEREVSSERRRRVRLRRATGLILLDISTASSLLRYFRRTLFEKDRLGALEGGRDSVKWDMIHHIAVITPKNRKRYRAMFAELDLPKLQLSSLRAIKKSFRDWDLAK